MADEKARLKKPNGGSIADRSRNGKSLPTPVKGIIEKWAYELLKNYNQDQAAKNLVDINPKFLKELTIAPGEWGYYSLEVGTYPPDKLAKIKSGLPLPRHPRGIVIDAGFSVRVIITGEPVGERFVDINFIDSPSLDYWVNGQLIEERVFSNIGEALKRIRPDLPRAIVTPQVCRVQR